MRFSENHVQKVRRLRQTTATHAKIEEMRKENMDMELSTAIVIIAPPRVQALAAPLMRRYSFESMLRVPAHITVLFPFVPPDALDDACHKLTRLYADFQPFDVTLDGYGHFPTATFLKIANPEPIKALFRPVHAEFPNFPPYGGAHGAHDIMPHMTVGIFKSEAARQAAEFPPYDPITFTVRRVHLIIGVAHEPIPWITYDVIPLGRRSND